MTGADRGHCLSETDVTEPLIDLLLETAKKLADLGHVDEACRIAGQACAILRNTHPTGEHRFNVLLHRLTPKLDW
jgi:hypothetical protein